MRKEKFIYNTQSLQYEKAVTPLRVKIIRTLGYTLAVTLTSVVIISIANNFFPSPKEQAQQREIEQMEYHYSAMNNQIELMSKVLNNVQDRDASVHRMLFGMDPIDKDVWNSGVGGHERYANLTKFKNTGDLLIATQEKVDKLKNQLAIQSLSLEKIQQLAADKEVMLASVPAIKPVRSDKMKTTNMPKTIELSTTLAASPAKVIEHVCRSALLEYVSRGVLRVVPVEPPRFPEKWSEGQYRANLYLFGFLPVGWQVIGIEPETRCDETWSIRDNGYGWAIKAWYHTMEVTPIGEESYYTDRITLDAGVLTPMVTVFVKLLYGHRQRRWQKLVANDFDYDAA